MKSMKETSKALIFDKRNRILMLRTLSGQWDFPGGNFDGGESAEKCAIRETLEETRLKTKTASFIGRKKIEGKLRSLFILSVRGNQPVLSGEHNAYRWVKLDSLPKNMKPKARNLLSAFRHHNKMPIKKRKKSKLQPTIKGKTTLEIQR